MNQGKTTHIDQLLTNFVVNYANAMTDYIGLKLFPVVPVNNQSGVYPALDSKNSLTSASSLRGPRSEANIVDWSNTTGSYSCLTHALRSFVTDEEIANADAAFDVRSQTAQLPVDKLMLEFEESIATKAFTYANFGSSYRITLVTGTTRFDAYATSDPLGVIQTAKDACFSVPNTIVMGRAVYNALKQHPQILDKVKGGSSTASPAIVTERLLAELFEVENLWVGKTKHNTANLGQTASISDIWGKSLLVCKTDPSPGMNGKTWGKTFSWRFRAAGGQIYQVRSYRDEAVGGGGEFIEATMAFDPKVVCSDEAYLVYTAVD